MQKKQIIWILLGLIVFIPIARYIDTAPEREKVHLEKEKEEAERRDKERQEKERAEQEQLKQEKEQRLKEFYSYRSNALAPLQNVIRELESFLVPEPFLEVRITGTTYSDINFWGKHTYYDGDTDTHRECEFYIKDANWYFDPINHYFFVSCNDDELCIKRNGRRVSSFLDFYPQESPKLRQLIKSLYDESRRTQSILPGIQHQIDSLENEL